MNLSSRSDKRVFQRLPNGQSRRFCGSWLPRIQPWNWHCSFEKRQFLHSIQQRWQERQLERGLPDIASHWVCCWCCFYCFHSSLETEFAFTVASFHKQHIPTWSSYRLPKLDESSWLLHASELSTTSPFLQILRFPPPRFAHFWLIPYHSFNVFLAARFSDDNQHLSSNLWPHDALVRQLHHLTWHDFPFNCLLS